MYKCEHIFQHDFSLNINHSLIHKFLNLDQDKKRLTRACYRRVRRSVCVFPWWSVWRRDQWRMKPCFTHGQNHQGKSNASTSPSQPHRLRRYEPWAGRLVHWATADLQCICVMPDVWSLMFEVVHFCSADSFISHLFCQGFNFVTTFRTGVPDIIVSLPSIKGPPRPRGCRLIFLY